VHAPIQLEGLLPEPYYQHFIDLVCVIKIESAKGDVGKALQ
jgi:hypothetical protein